MNRYKSFLVWQHHVLNWLLQWGTASVVAGASMLGSARPVVRQAGIQALAWGAIDAVIAVLGRRGARQKLGQQIEDAAVEREMRRFTQIVAVNAGLDVLYMLGGGQLIRRAGADQRRHGMGLGIVAQGLFLFVFDSYLTWRMLRWPATGRDAQ